MAKKSRRARKQGRQVKLSTAQLAQPLDSEAGNGSVVSASVRPAGQTADLREEYGYVIADLKRIGLLAVVMLAVLIVLALTLT